MLLTSILFLAPLLLLSVVSQLWLSIVLVAVALILSAAVLFAILGVATFYGLPGLRIEDGALLVKAEGGRVRRYAYDKVAAIRQVSSTAARGELYHLEVGFADGAEWSTARRGEAALPVLRQFSDLLSERSGRPVSPTFAA